MDGGWSFCFLKDFCPAGRARCARGGHFVACVPVLQDDLHCSSRWSGENEDWRA
jgi:hypothetical protein